LSTFSLRARIFRLLVSSGVRERKPELEKVPNGEMEPDTRLQYERRDVMQCHGLRKFFSTTCTLQGLPPLTVEVLMGHKALGITGVYFKPTPNDLLEGNDKMLGYANIMKSLTISEEHKLRLEVKQLTKEQDEIAIMKLEHQKQINALRVELEPLLTLKDTLISEGVLKEHHHLI
jgi:hypothetical protein